LKLFFLFGVLPVMIMENGLQRLDFICHEALFIKVVVWAAFGCTTGAFEG
jgi:hypothetical protein